MRPFVILFALVLFACAGPEPVDGAPEGLTLGELGSFLRGRDLFLHETFDGNGRTCSSCHLRRFVGDNFDFTPADAEELFEADPTNPLFRSIDAAGGTGTDYTVLRTHALVRIPFVLPPNVTVDEPDGPSIHTNADGTRTVFVLRSTPSIENIALEENIMWDGREGSDLAHQAGSAVQTHYQPGRLPTTAEKNDIAFFQRQFFTQFSTRAFAAGGASPTLPTVPAGALYDSQRRGRNFFVPMAVTPTMPVRGGHCATCHSGAMLDTTDAFSPAQPPGLRRSNSVVSELNTPDPTFPVPDTQFGLSLPELTYHVTLLHPVFMPAGIPLLPIPPGTPLFPPGTTFTRRSPDLGAIYTTGDPCEQVTDCLINSNPTTGTFSTVSTFRISSLWGSADTAPYFHDNSCVDLECVLRHYQTGIFVLTAIGTGNPAWNLSPQEEADIVAYMRFAFVRTTTL